MHSQRRFADTSYDGGTDHCQRPSGLGRLVCEMKDSKVIFTGELRRGIAEGHGVLRMADDSVFAGQFVDGNIKGYGVFTARSGTRIRGFFLNNDLVTLQGSVVFSDGTAGVPFHEGIFSEDKKFVTSERCPDVLALAQDNADRAFQFEKMYENKETETNEIAAAENADTISLATTSNILELDQLEEALAGFELDSVLHEPETTSDTTHETTAETTPSEPV